MSQELRLSTIINSLAGYVSAGSTVSGGSSTSVIPSIQFEVGTVTVGTEAAVTITKQNGVNKLNFVLPSPINDLTRLSSLIAETSHRHIIDTIGTQTTPLTQFELWGKANSCPIIIIFRNKVYAEVPGIERAFQVNRGSDKTTILWNADTAGVTLSSTTGEKVYVHYEQSTVVSHVRQNIDISTITNNSFLINDTPNTTKAVIIINGVVYFEDKGDFTLNRSTGRVVWNSGQTGFSINTNTLSGYLTLCYDKTIG